MKFMTRFVKTNVLAIVAISILLAVQFHQFWEPEMEATPSNFVHDEAGDADFTSDILNNFENNEPEFPVMDLGHFTENLGQWEDHIRFLAQTSFGYAALGTDGIFYYIVNENEDYAFKVNFENVQEVFPIGEGDLDFESNYFFGNDASKWISDARSYEKVIYKDVWPGIDIIYYFKGQSLKYDIIVGEYSDPALISFNLDGHKDLEILDKELGISLSDEISISDNDLVAFYDDGELASIQFKKTGESSYGFDVQKTRGRKLTIDPVLFSKSTYLGGSAGEMTSDVVVDQNNDIIVLGGTNSNDFPNTTGAFQNSFAGAFDIVVTKFNSDLSDIIFSTYIGDWSSDIPRAVDVDENGDIYVTGSTYSWYFPTTNGSFQEDDPSPSFPDAFVLKLAAQGNDLIYSTYVGGTGSDGAEAIKVQNGLAYVTGNALSYDFPTVGFPVMDAHGTVFFFIMNENGSNLLHSVFWGGWSNEFGYSIAIDINGDVIIGGVTYSQDFPVTPGAYQTTVNDMANGFIIKYQLSSNTTIFSTYIGGDAGDNVNCVFVDENAVIYFAGTTAQPGATSQPFPTTPGAYDTSLNGTKDAYIAKMDPFGTTLVYSTFIGGEGDEGSGEISVDAKGNVIFTGSIDSELNFSVTPDAYDSSYNDEGDSFLLILDQGGSRLIYATFLGGNASDSADACFLTNDNEIILSGTTASLDFPVTNGSFQTENKGNGDLFVTKFSNANIIYLHEGWNLISIPEIQADTNPLSVLSPISGHYDAVQMYDASDSLDPWKHHHNTKSPHFNDLVYLDHLVGFWVHITKPGGVMFKYSGSPITSLESISLKTGWNLVGYPSMTQNQRVRGLNNLEFGVDVDAIQWYDSATQTWHFLEDGDLFFPGRGFWIHSKFDVTWDVPL